MKKLFLGALLLLPIAACTPTEQGAAIGGGSGAVVGALVARPGNEAGGALVGGALGAVAGALIGNASERPGYCEYRDRRGDVYVDRCPDGYRAARYDDRRYERRGYDDPRYERRRYDDEYRPRYRRSPYDY